jgi:hypothetical protein
MKLITLKTPEDKYTFVEELIHTENRERIFPLLSTHLLIYPFTHLLSSLCQTDF